MAIPSIIKPIVIVLIAINLCAAQLYHQPIAYALQQQPRQPRILEQGLPIAISDPSQLVHPAVAENSIRESQLPPELLKSNRFFSDPKTAELLSKDSWLTSKESPVFDREADKIPREQILKIFKNAGFVQRRRR